MSDTEIVAELRECERKLNEALRKAAGASIHVEAHFVEVTVMDDPAPVFMLNLVLERRERL